MQNFLGIDGGKQRHDEMQIFQDQNGTSVRKKFDINQVQPEIIDAELDSPIIDYPEVESPLSPFNDIHTKQLFQNAFPN